MQVRPIGGMKLSVCSLNHQTRCAFKYTNKGKVWYSTISGEHPYNTDACRQQRKRAEQWYWKNRLTISSQYLHKAILAEEGKVIKSFDSLAEADAYQLTHCPGAFLTVVGDEEFDKRVLKQAKDLHLPLISKTEVDPVEPLVRAPMTEDRAVSSLYSISTGVQQNKSKNQICWSLCNSLDAFALATEYSRFPSVSCLVLSRHWVMEYLFDRTYHGSPWPQRRRVDLSPWKCFCCKI